LSEDLVQRELISTQVTPEIVAFMGELDSKCHHEVKKIVNIRVEFGLDYPKFYPESLDEARGDPICPPVLEDSYLNTWTLRGAIYARACKLFACFIFVL
jgi:hypothetical protein